MVLGDMLELGAYSESAHQNLEPLILDAGVSVVFSIGQYSNQIQLPEDVGRYYCKSKSDLNKVLLAEVKTGDVILVKGSRSMKLEETVQYLREHI